MVDVDIKGYYKINITNADGSPLPEEALRLDSDRMARICALNYALLNKNIDFFRDLIAFYT
jgi:hypothetical protein